jgi:hypothetical protein
MGWGKMGEQRRRIFVERSEAPLYDTRERKKKCEYAF